MVDDLQKQALKNIMHLGHLIFCTFSQGAYSNTPLQMTSKWMPTSLKTCDEDLWGNLDQCRILGAWRFRSMSYILNNETTLNLSKAEIKKFVTEIFKCYFHIKCSMITWTYHVMNNKTSSVHHAIRYFSEMFLLGCNSCFLLKWRSSLVAWHLANNCTTYSTSITVNIPNFRTLFYTNMTYNILTFETGMWYFQQNHKADYLALHIPHAPVRKHLFENIHLMIDTFIAAGCYIHVAPSHGLT